MCELTTLKNKILEKITHKQEVLNDKKRELDNEHGMFNQNACVIGRAIDKHLSEIKSLEWVCERIEELENETSK